MTDKFDPQSPEAQALAADALARREFLKKLGKYAAVTSVSTATLLTAQTATAASAAYCAKASCLPFIGSCSKGSYAGCRCTVFGCVPD
ncbi:MAG: hypothetical protein QJT81_09535 [Candidatus Thiothrix putei]|uniref:Uncharacterized protein n=1 Tax=Candidatus Thiothrix putei TaxID=3080811 RepID=A0AA95KK71_9GAMM|nr:MAG: hypothetical protein QJT81_09535 [Candidatus Thiothrix putei]